MLSRILLFFATVLACCSVADCHELTANHGALYRVQHDGKTAYLYGTIHVGKHGALPLPPEVAIRYVTRASDRFALRARLYQSAVQLLAQAPRPLPTSAVQSA